MSSFHKILFSISFILGVLSLIDIAVPTQFKEYKILDNRTELVKRKNNPSDYQYYFQVQNKSIWISYEQYELFNSTKDSTIFITKTFLFKNVKAYTYHGYTSYSFSILSSFLMPLLLVLFSVLGFIVKKESRTDKLVIVVTMLLALTIYIKFL
jgi:hypothetical protein